MLKEEKRVSYILVTYNRAEYLEKIINNVREFITTDDELLIMDGGSSDNTTDTIKKHADIVTLFESEIGSGIIHSLNKGILLAKGRYVVNLTDDDYFFPEGFTQAISIMEKHPEIDAVICGGEYCQINMQTGNVELLGYQYLPPSRTLSSDMRNFFHITTAGFFILRKRIIARAGLFDTTVQAADTEYFSRLLLSKANFKYLNVKLFRHISHPFSSEVLHSQQAHRDRIMIAVQHKLWDEVAGYPWSEVCAALGLQEYPLGGWTSDRILLAQYLRRFKRLNRLLPWISWIVTRFCLTGISIIVKLKNIRPVANVKHTQNLVEPVWDGSLH